MSDQNDDLAAAFEDPEELAAYMAFLEDYGHDEAWLVDPEDETEEPDDAK